MTTTQTGVSDYDARIERAERLSAANSFASEFLDFYKQVARFQKNLRGSIEAASGMKSGGLFAAALRDDLDLTVLLPHFRGYLSVIEQNAPRAFRESAHQISLLSSNSWIASLGAYWVRAGKYDQQVGAFAKFIPRAFLQPYAELLSADRQAPPVVTTPRVCPICGARPLIGILRPEGNGGKRFLLCSFCSQEWELRRILCPTCGEEAEVKLPVYVAEQFPHSRVEICDTCKFYLLTLLGRPACLRIPR